MKLKSILSSLVLIIALSACANKTEQINSLLWKVSGNGLGEPSYIFGTHHLVPVSFLDEVNGLNEAFGSIQQVVGELDMSKMASMQMSIMQKSIMPDGYDYKELLSEEDYQLLSDKVLEVIGMDFSMLDKMRPAMINNLLMITLYQKYYPSLEGGIGIDQHFQDKARESNLNVEGLETADDQIYVLLEQQSIERQVELLICSLKNPELLKEQMDKLQDAYMAQDLSVLAEMYYDDSKVSPCPSTDEEKHLMNADRNNKWLELLPEMMSNKPALVAVGCLHLVGDEGLIEGLRKLGYKVEPIR